MQGLWTLFCLQERARLIDVVAVYPGHSSDSSCSFGDEQDYACKFWGIKWWARLVDINAVIEAAPARVHALGDAKDGLVARGAAWPASQPRSIQVRRQLKDPRLPHLRRIIRCK